MDIAPNGHYMHSFLIMSIMVPIVLPKIILQYAVASLWKVLTSEIIDAMWSRLTVNNSTLVHVPP